VVLGAGLLASPAAASFLRLESRVPVMVLAAYVAMHFLLSGPRGLLLGAGRLYYLSVVTLLDPLVRVAVAVPLVLSGGNSTGALFAYVAGNMAATLVAVLPFLRPALRELGTRRPALTQLMTYDRGFLFVVYVNVALMVLPSIDPVAVRRFFSEEVAGTYAAAFLLGRIILLSTNAASWVVFSRAVQMRANDPRLRRVVARGIATSGGIAGLVTAAYWIAPEAAAHALGGSAYTAAAAFVGLVGLEMVLFSVVSVLAYYHIAIHNTRLWLAFTIALGLEAALIAANHATPRHILVDTMVTLGLLLVWLGVETVRVMRPSAAERRHTTERPRLCMVVHSHYPSDPRVRREAEAMLAEGWDVDVICVPDGGEPEAESVNGVRAWRMPVRRNRFGSQASYLMEYGRFFLAAAWRLLREHLRRPYHVVQVHNMPDFLVFAALGPRLLGARVVLDVHDLVPEFYALRYGLPLDHRLVRLMRLVQRASVRFADHVLTAGEPFRRQLCANGGTAERITSIMNSPDPVLFSAPPERVNGHGAAHPNGHEHRRAGEPFVLSYHGTLSEYNDLTVVLRALALLRDELPDLRLHVYGRGRALPGLQALAAELDLGDRAQFFGFRALDEMPAAIAGATLGIVPQRRSAFTSLNYPTKAFEYIALGIPVLMAWTPALDELFGHVNGVFFETNDPAGLAERLRALYHRPELRRQMAQQQQAVCAAFAWAAERRRYCRVMNQVLLETEAVLETAGA
jgi:glycosyltransferase involved in cell wall biosynthesis